MNTAQTGGFTKLTVKEATANVLIAVEVGMWLHWRVHRQGLHCWLPDPRTSAQTTL